MQIRRLALGVLGVSIVSFTACTNTTVIQVVDSSTTRPPATSAPAVTDTVDTGEATTVARTAPATPAPTKPATTPAPTQPPATTPAPTKPPTTQAPSLSLYDEVKPPKSPNDQTDPFVSSGALDNGYYWVIYNGGETLTPDITVYQAYFGDACVAKAAENGEECTNDIYVPEDVSRDIDDLPFIDDVYLTVSDEQSQKSYWITPDELREIRGSSPSDPAPPDYGFASFPFLMTVKNGKITKFEQLWTP